ncbi:unnamed protein product [Spirodela intermedia]|uniref:Uncharacterized protein n=1 Tax=Spirodela intermedia TaxID=51605 RepID=A0A7I8KGF7_SPIIN|nr:unnamed protein product [Spirodela intermedia]
MVAGKWGKGRQRWMRRLTSQKLFLLPEKLSDGAPLSVNDGRTYGDDKRHVVDCFHLYGALSSSSVGCSLLTWRRRWCSASPVHHVGYSIFSRIFYHNLIKIRETMTS